MATEGQVVDAINHILKHQSTWRGGLNDSDYELLSKIFLHNQNPKTRNPEAFVPDTLIGALRNQWPLLFDGPELVEPPPPVGPPPEQLPPPGVPHPDQLPPQDELSGAAATAKQHLEAALAKNKTALNTADEELAEAVLNAHTTAETGKGALQGLQQQIIDKVSALGPTLDTPAGQRELAEFLRQKTEQIQDVLKNAKLDNASQAAIVKGLTDRYEAIAAGGLPADPPAGTPDNPKPTPAPAPTAVAGDPAHVGGDAPIGGDPLPGGLGDPLLGGLGALAPAMGALGGLPASLGSMLPMGGGGGMPFGDLGSAVGSALRDADGSDRRSTHVGDGDDIEELKDSAQKPEAADEAAPKPASTNTSDQGAATPLAGAGGGSTPPAAGSQVRGTPAAAAAVELPDGTTRTAATPALAKAGNDVLNGTGIDEAFPAAGIQLAPLGSPVTTPIAPGQLQFGDIGEYNDHRVMALGGNKVWSNGQVTALEQLQTGPNFLGWRRAAVPVTTIPPAALAGAVSPLPQ